jgi:hypothetical protein
MQIKWSKSDDPREPWIREISLCCQDCLEYGRYRARISRADGAHLVLCLAEERDEDSDYEEDFSYSAPVRFCPFCGSPISFVEYTEGSQPGQRSGDVPQLQTSGGDSHTPRTAREHA